MRAVKQATEGWSNQLIFMCSCQIFLCAVMFHAALAFLLSNLLHFFIRKTGKDKTETGRYGTAFFDNGQIAKNRNLS